MTDEYREALLKKNYHENCSGCKVDKMKAQRRGFPFKELLSIWAVELCTSLPITSLVPFLYFMIRDLQIAEIEEHIGFYVGLVGSSFRLGRTLTCVLWGIVADRYGRKPVLLMGTISVVIFNTLFGLSVNFWMAIGTRFLLGVFNGLLGPIKAYAMEIIREEDQAIALSAVSTAWGIALIIGPAIGGFLAQPTEKFPSVFPKKSLFGRFPYFLPCCAVSVFALIMTIISLWLPETLHNHSTSTEDSNETLEAASGNSNTTSNAVESSGTKDSSKDSLLKNWPLISSILVCCVFGLHDMAYSEIFSLWANSPKKYGGLSYSSQEVGSVLSITGVGLLVFQLLVYAYLERLLGPIMVTRLAACFAIPLLSSYPFIARLSGTTLSVLLSSASVLKNVLSVSATTSLYIMQNRAVNQHQRGAANGIVLTAMSFCKAIGPAAAGTLFSWSEKRQDAWFLPGTQIIFFILNVILAVGIVLTFKPFLTEHPRR